MKIEKQTPVKVKKRKISTSSSDSSDRSQNESTKKRPKHNTSRVLVEESNANGKQANVTIRIENADSLAKYRKMNPNVEIQNPKTTSNFTDDDISDDDEIWMCDIPNSIDVNKLIGQSIKLGSKKSTIHTDDGDIQCSSSKYESSNVIYDNSLSVIFQKNDGQFSMKNIKPVGRIMFHQKIAKSEIELDLKLSDRHECTIFPDNLVVRHPLLGRNYEDKINVSKAIQKNLDEAKIASSSTEVSVQIKQEKDEISIESPTLPKKSKKRKIESIGYSPNMKKRKNEIKIENTQDDDLNRIKQIFENNN